ncbi:MULTISPECIES: DUF4259 domain-containing protein [unclassified Paenibacillus]|uniref:DUF4259 domain-containing protein n=1 Tax=unclassified Paenibacillus TaxID=185978 RepID=UPI00362ABD58
MGVWGIGNFENDTVQDWIIELTETQDIILLSESIEMVLEQLLRCRCSMYCLRSSRNTGSVTK